MFEINDSKIKMMRRALTLYAFSRKCTVLDMLRGASKGLDEDHPLNQAINYLEDPDSTDQARAVATLDLNKLFSFEPAPDSDLVDLIENRAHRFMGDGGKIPYNGLHDALAKLAGKDRSPMFDLAADAAMDKIKADDRIVKFNGNDEIMSGKGRWTKIGHDPTYQANP